MKEYLTVREAARRLGVNRKTITRWIIEGYLPGATRLNPHLKRSPYRIPPDSVQAILDDRERAASGSVIVREREPETAPG